MKAILIDDEPRSAENLRILLEDHCPQLQVSALCTDARNCIATINELKPDVIFLDVEMPHVDGFSVLSAVRSSIRHVIFTTAHEEYAIQAIREQAFDYLLKPVDPDDLVRAIKRIPDLSAPAALNKSLERIVKLEQLIHRQIARHVAIQTVEGYVVVDHEDIIRMEAESNYTHIFCPKKKFTVAKLLGSFEEQLADVGFVRVHSSHLVNLKHVRSYQRGDGGYLVMSDGIAVEVSRSRKKELMRVLLGAAE
jgi:two-component system, LytTR family, response regulator